MEEAVWNGGSGSDEERNSENSGAQSHESGERGSVANDLEDGGAEDRCSVERKKSSSKRRSTDSGSEGRSSMVCLSKEKGSGCWSSRSGFFENSSPGATEPNSWGSGDTEDTDREPKIRESEKCDSKGSLDEGVKLGNKVPEDNGTLDLGISRKRSMGSGCEERDYGNISSGGLLKKTVHLQDSQIGQEQVNANDDSVEEVQISLSDVLAAEEEALLQDSVTPSIKLFMFNIVLPTMDIFLDITMIQKLFTNGYYGCGTLVVTGIVTNSIFTSLAWLRLEPKDQKKWSWIFLLLQLWPQLRALQVAPKLNMTVITFAPGDSADYQGRPKGIQREG